MASQLNLADFIAGTQSSNSQIQEELLRSTSQGVSILDQIATRNQKGAEAARLVVETAGLAEAKAQQQSLDAATLLGTNADASTYVLADYITQKNEKFAEARALNQQIAAKKATTLANPIDWIMGQLTVNNDIAAYNAAATDYNLVGRQIDDLVSMTQDVDKMNLAIAKTKTVESVKAEAEVAANRLLDIASKAQVDALQFNTDGLLKVQQLRQQQLTTAFQAREMQMSEARLALAQQSAGMEAQRLSLALKKDKQEDQDKAISLASWNAFRQSVGMPAGTQQMFDMTYRADPDGTVKEINNGLRTLVTKRDDPTADARFLSDTPAGALELASKYGLNLDAGRGSLLNLTQGVLATIQKTSPDVLKNRNAALSAINEGVKAEATRQHTAIRSSDNIYAPPSMQTLLDQSAIQRTASGQLVLKPLLDSGQKAFEPKLVVPQILEQVKRGKIPLNQALNEITMIANASMAYNNQYRSYKATMGIPDQSALNVPMETTGVFAGIVNQATARANNSPFAAPVQAVFGGSKVSIINLADPAQVQDYANRYLAGSIMPQLKLKAQQAQQR